MTREEIEAMTRNWTDDNWANWRIRIDSGEDHMSRDQDLAVLAYVQELAQSSLIAAAVRSPRGCSWQAFECADRFGCIEHDGTLTAVGRRRDKHANWIPTPLGRAILRVLEGDRG